MADQREYSQGDTQPIDLGEFNDYVDAMVERDALKHRVESLEATLSDISTSAEQAKRLLMRGMLSVRDMQVFIAGLITTANNARPLVAPSRKSRGVL